MIESMCPRCGMNKMLGAVCPDPNCPVENGTNKSKPDTRDPEETIESAEGILPYLWKDDH